MMSKEKIIVGSVATTPFVTIGLEAVEAIIVNANTKIVLRDSPTETVAAETETKASQKAGI